MTINYVDPIDKLRNYFRGLGKITSAYAPPRGWLSVADEIEKLRHEALEKTQLSKDPIYRERAQRNVRLVRDEIRRIDALYENDRRLASEKFESLSAQGGPVTASLTEREEGAQESEEGHRRERPGGGSGPPCERPGIARGGPDAQ